MFTKRINPQIRLIIDRSRISTDATELGIKYEPNSSEKLVEGVEKSSIR